MLSKHFFSYKYDYREEWSNFTRTLSGTDKNIPEQVIVALANLVHSEGGVLWVREEDGFKQIAQWGMSGYASSSNEGIQELRRSKLAGADFAAFVKALSSHLADQSEQ